MGKKWILKMSGRPWIWVLPLFTRNSTLPPILILASNIFLGREPGNKGFINEQELHAEASRHLKRVGLNLPSDTIAGSLPIGKQQLVEIAKALIL